jgi:hypothetical protein
MFQGLSEVETPRKAAAKSLPKQPHSHSYIHFISNKEEVAALSNKELALASLIEANKSLKDIVALIIDKEKAHALKECYYNLIARYFSAYKT